MSAFTMCSLWHALYYPWTQGFMQRALVEVVLLGIAGGAIGCWIVLYEMSFSAEALVHSMFPGLVGAALLGLPALLGGVVGIAFAAIAITVAGRNPQIGRDTAVAVVVMALLGLGTVLAFSPSSPPGIDALLFGHIFGVSDLDLALAAVLVVMALVALRLLHGQLLVVGFDRENSRFLGGHPALADATLLLLIALASVIAVQGLGNLLVVAVLVAPAATARLVAKRVVPMMVMAVLLAIAGGVLGLYTSYYVGTAGGASVAGAMLTFYFLILIAKTLSRIVRVPRYDRFWLEV